MMAGSSRLSRWRLIPSGRWEPLPRAASGLVPLVFQAEFVRIHQSRSHTKGRVHGHFSISLVLCAPAAGGLLSGAASELGKRISADGWEVLKTLAGKIQKKAEARPALQEALTDARSAPQDEDALAALRLQLEKLLQEDPDLRAEAGEERWGTSRPASTTVIASGNRSGGDWREMPVGM